MENEEVNHYAPLYIQRQESIAVEFMRKSIDLEIKVMSLTAAVQELEQKFEESQKQVEIQNDMMAQAAKGMESLNSEKEAVEKERDDFCIQIKDLQKRCDQINLEKAKVLTDLANVEQTINNFKKQSEELKKEYTKQTEELNSLYKENEELRGKLPQLKKKTIVLEKSDDMF